MEGNHEENNLELLKRRAKNAWDVSQRVEAITQINDEDFLMELVFHDLSSKVREVACKKITSPEKLAIIAKRSKYEPLRKYAVETLDDESLLTEVVIDGSYDSSKLLAFKKIYNPELLAKIAVAEGSVYAETVLKILSTNLEANYGCIRKIAMESNEPPVVWKAIELLSQATGDLSEIFFAIATYRRFPWDDRIRALALIEKESDVIEVLVRSLNEFETDELSDVELHDLLHKDSIRKFVQTGLSKISNPLQLLTYSLPPDFVLPWLVESLSTADQLKGALSNSMFAHMQETIISRLIKEFGDTSDVLMGYPTFPAHVRKAIIDLVGDNAILKSLYSMETSDGLKLSILKKIPDGSTFVSLVQNEPREFMATLLQEMPERYDSLPSNLKDGTLPPSLELEKIASNQEAYEFIIRHAGTGYETEALSKISDNEILVKLILSDKVRYSTKLAAIEKISNAVELQTMLFLVTDEALADAIRKRIEVLE